MKTLQTEKTIETRMHLRPSLDRILSQSNPLAPIDERLVWLSDLFWWIRTPSAAKNVALDFVSGQGQLARVRYILKLLERNPEWETKFAQTLRSIVRETEAVDLFSRAGLPSQMSLTHELMERLMGQILPTPPRERDLGELFAGWFPEEGDANWVEKIEADILLQIGRLLDLDAKPEESGWNTLPREMADAILLLASQVRVQGLSSAIRKRAAARFLRESPFFVLVAVAEQFVNAMDKGSTLETARHLQAFKRTLEQCRSEMSAVYDHLNDFGVSLNIVYQLERMEAELLRIATLMNLIHRGFKAKDIAEFMAYLIRENVKHRSLRYILSENLGLLARRIAERNAEKGIHYITRSPGEYVRILKSALGGGLITGPTVVLKTFVDQAALPSMLTGALVSTTYATSFVSIQMLGFTLATKQPAMTAPAIAAKLAEISKEGDLQPLVEEIAALIRTQFAATFGNVMMVIPTVTLFHFLILWWSGETMLSAQHARAIVDKHSLLGPSPFFAGITGVILWFSSLIAGYVDNWSAYRQVPEAIGSHRKLQMIFGVSRLRILQKFITKHITALSSNIALGFLLGMFPKVCASFGLPLDVRHVTLATGLVSLSVLSLGVGSLSSFDWFVTFSGLLSIGLMNIGVSFAFALRVAIQARGVATVRRQEIYKALLYKATRRPLDFLVPRQAAVKSK